MNQSHVTAPEEFDMDLEEFDDCDSDIEVGDANTLPIFENDTSEKKEKIISSATVESVEKQRKNYIN